MSNHQERRYLVQYAAQTRLRSLALKPGQSVDFIFKTPEEASVLATTLAELFPDPEKAELGMRELLLNAIEHGNLEIGFDEKSQLLEQGLVQREIEKRLKLPYYSERTGTLTLHATDTYLEAIITDQGQGFEWQPYLCIDERRLNVPHGRGIAIANMLCFDKLQYNETGNEVRALCLT